jgi:hypothetical protein
MIDGALRGKLEPGTVLTARYRKVEYRATVVAGEDGRILFELEDGRQFRSPSAAASAVMGGTAANGWRWWSLQADTGTTDAKATPVKARKPRKSKATAEPVETSEADESEAPTEEFVTE